VEPSKERRIGRRGLIKGAVGLAAASSVVGVPALTLLDGDADSRTVVEMAPVNGSHDPIVVYVNNAANGEVVIMSGLQETVVTDHGLVGRLLSAGSV
jgi:hypothetical protein